MDRRKSKTTSVLKSNVTRKPSSRSMGRVTASPSILRNPAGVALNRFRKRLFMNQAAFAARLGLKLSILKAMEAGGLNTTLSLMPAIHNLGRIFSIPTDELEPAIRMQGLPSLFLELLWAQLHLGFPPQSLDQITSAMQRLGCVAPSADIAAALQTLRHFNYATVHEQISVWTGRLLVTAIQITPEGEQLLFGGPVGDHERKVTA